ncbi:MAG: PspC domain-containing protein [Flavobacteriales bacterium]|nr:PspC domain-containing protein [Flavobacteriales bacterium]
MNRTITSNIAGTVFHIDEDAFRKLEQYLKDIRGFYSGQDGEDDIVSGIEERIGDIFSAKVKGGQSIITMNDVDAVIVVMGRPEAFEGDEDDAPTARTSSKKRSGNVKRLFRDPDSRVLGGVCSGISHYFGIVDPVWFRLAFLLTFVFAGSGLLLYLILWVVIPSAKTPSDKLEMKGENVTVDNISRTVNEELEGLRQKWDRTAVGSNGAVRQIGGLVMRAISFIVQFIIALVRFIGRFLGLALLVVGVLAFMSILGVSLGLPTIISLGSEGVVTSGAVHGLLSNFAGGQVNAVLAGMAVLLLGGVPMLALAFLGARLLFNFGRVNKWIGISLASLWTLGFILSFVMAAIIGKDFSVQGERSQTVAMEFASGTDERPLVLDLNHELGDDEPTEEVDVMGLQILVADGVTSIYGKPSLDIVKSTNGKVELDIVRKSRGGDQREASERANAIDYGFLSNDSALLFNGYFAIPDADKWRSQEAQLELRIPEGTTILLTEDMERIIYDIKNVTNTFDGDMVGRRWKMTEKGLVCVDCDGLDVPRQVRRTKVTVEIEAEMDSLKEELTREHEQMKRELEEEKQQMKRNAEQMKEDGNVIRKRMIEKKVESSTGTDAGTNKVIEKRIIKKEAGVSSNEGVSEILLQRVVRATYRLGPETIRSITYTIPG